MDYIYLRAGRVRLRGWGVKANFIFLPWGGGGLWKWGVQNKFFKTNDPGQFEKFRLGGHMGVLTNIYFQVFFSFNAVASVEVYLPAGKDKANLIFLPGGLWVVQDKFEQKSRG